MKPLALALVAAAVAAVVVAAEKPPQVEADVKTLKDAGVEASDEGLLKFVVGLRPTPEVRQEIAALVGRLGSTGFDDREEASRRLAAMIRFARPELQRASRSTDREVARRAKALLTEKAEEAAAADRRADTLLAVLREIARRKTPGAVPALLNSLPLCERPDILKAAARALAASARPADADALRQALGSPDLHVRTAAVVAYDAILGDKVPEELGRLLEDGDDGVRQVTALALLNRGDRRALQALGKLLDSPDLPTRNRAAKVLRGVTGKDIDFVAYAAPGVRAKAAAEWRRWIKEQSETVRLALPAPVDTRLGKVLLCQPGGDRVLELDERGQKVWEAALEKPWCCQGLPNGHRLVGTKTGRVQEYDAEGETVWGLEGLLQPVLAVQRLASGNTLVAHGTREKSLIQEFRPDRTVCREVSWPRDYPLDVQSLDNGNLLVGLCFSTRVVELDWQGKVVWEVRGLRFPFSVQRLEGGNVVVSKLDVDTGEVVEMNPAGRVVWSHTIAEPMYAQRLRNGHTLISNRERVVEIDAAGKVRAKYAVDFVSRLSAY